MSVFMKVSICCCLLPGKGLYTFDLRNRNYLFYALSQSSIFPLSSKGSFVTWNDDYDLIEIISFDGTENMVYLDSSIVSVKKSDLEDSIFVFTSKTYYILDSKGTIVFEKGFPAADSISDFIDLSKWHGLLTYRDSTITRFSYDLRPLQSFFVRGNITFILPIADGSFMVLTKNGSIEAYAPDFRRLWGFSNYRLKERYIGDELAFYKGVVYKLNSNGDYLSFDTTGKMLASGSFRKNTTLPGGNFHFDFS